MKSTTTHYGIAAHAAITGDTPMQQAGAIASAALKQGTWEMESMCNHAVELISDLDVDTDTMTACAVLKAMVLRMRDINSLLMSFHDGEDLSVDHLYRVMFGYSVGKQAFLRALADQTATEERDNVSDEVFAAGVRLARTMLEEAQAREDDQLTNNASEAKRWMRGGAAIDSFAQGYVMRVVGEPGLIPGFSAGLSCALNAGISIDPGELDVPVAEFRAGARGADGTDPGEEGATWQNESVAPSRAKPRKAAPTGKETAAVAA